MGIERPEELKLIFKGPTVTMMIPMQFVCSVNVDESVVTRIQTQVDDIMSVAFVAELQATVFQSVMSNAKTPKRQTVS